MALQDVEKSIGPPTQVRDVLSQNRLLGLDEVVCYCRELLCGSNLSEGRLDVLLDRVKEGTELGQTSQNS